MECIWSEKEELNSDYWECNRCEIKWILNDGTPFDNEMHYCPGCGAEIKSVIFTEYDTEQGEFVRKEIKKQKGRGDG